MRAGWMRNPVTGRPIKRNGPTHRRLVQSGLKAKHFRRGRRVKVVKSGHLKIRSTLASRRWAKRHARLMGYEWY
jgi:hypothetical protein